ncbi:MAG: leucine-rich repeat domain-containing protein [Prevotella sp.]|nr:leucine-rich repeat domain-containing protein [Prevotella sp.]
MRSNSDNPYSGDITIPETVDYNGKTYSVTVIGQSAFERCEELTSVVIPNSVTSISKWAFFDCPRLASVTIGNSVNSIGIAAFYGCHALTSVTFPNSIIAISDHAFGYCTGLTEITIPNSVTTIGMEAFRRCFDLTTVTIGNSVTNIGEFAFSECDDLTSVISLIEEPFEISENVFQVYNSETYVFEFAPATLYVPTGTKAKYESTPAWNKFANIVEGTENAVKSVETGVKAEETERYNVSGQRISSPQKGLNMVRMSDGTTRKVMCK